MYERIRRLVEALAEQGVAHWQEVLPLVLPIAYDIVKDEMREEYRASGGDISAPELQAIGMLKLAHRSVWDEKRRS